MAPKKRSKSKYGEGSIYQRSDGSWAIKVSINGRVVERSAPDESAAREKQKELLALKQQSQIHVSDIDGLTMACNLWLSKTPPDKRAFYQELFTIRLYPVLEEMKRIDRESVSVAQHAQTVQEWLSVWFDEVKRGRNLKPNTVIFYERIIRAYILPVIGEYRLYELNPTIVQNLVNSIREDIYAASDGRDTGIRTARGVYGLLRDSFGLAIQRGYIERHPCDGVIQPAMVSRDIHPLSDAHLLAFLTASRQAKYPSLWSIYGLLGLRRAEALALSWSAIDWNKRTLRIDHQVQNVDGKLTLISPKTMAGKRTIPIPDFVYQALHKEWEELDEKHAGYIFRSRNGGLIWSWNIEGIFRSLCSQVGIPDTFTLHHLRHTVATLLDETGASETIKAGILGHGKGNAISNRYTHARHEAMKVALAAVEERILGSTNQRVSL